MVQEKDVGEKRREKRTEDRKKKEWSPLCRGAAGPFSITSSGGRSRSDKESQNSFELMLKWMVLGVCSFRIL